ncbi:MAG: tetratricopeptide repeat protein, partial [Phycisphaerales bacterium]|nr:tetratricopeptide repeat protein [Phycisphaerales bacterium]
ETSLAITMEMLGDVEGAERIYRTSVARARTSGDPEVLMSSLQNLGLCLQDQRRFDEAIPLLRENMDLTLAHFGDAHPETAASYLNLAVAVLNEGDLDEAEALSTRGAEISEQAQGASHLVTLWLRANLGYVMHEQGRFQESEALLREILGTVETVVEPGARLPLDIRLYLVFTALSQHRNDDARREAEARHAIVVETYSAWPDVVEREVEATARAFEAADLQDDAAAWRAR